MKASEAVLLVIRDQGGQVKTTQFSAWLGRLAKAGYLELAAEGEEETFKVMFKLTEKGRSFLQQRGL